jgi:hypothetical protein
LTWRQASSRLEASWPPGVWRDEAGSTGFRDEISGRDFWTRFADEVFLAMSAYPPPPPGGVGQRIEEAIELIEMELRHAAAYVNDAVIPHVRRESISAMRTLADTLKNLADRMDQGAGGPKDPRS